MLINANVLNVQTKYNCKVDHTSRLDIYNIYNTLREIKFGDGKDLSNIWIQIHVG